MAKPIGISHLPFVVSSIVTQGYGGDTSHNIQPYSIDFAAKEKTPVMAIASGIVVGLRTGSFNGDKAQGMYGNYVTVRHDDGTYATYAHFYSSDVYGGMAVTAGKTVVGLSGNTGFSLGPHLHIHFGTNLVNGRADGSRDSVPPVFFTTFFPSSEVEGLIDATHASAIRATDIFGTSASDGDQKIADIFRGTDVDNRMFGGAGNDTLLGFGGNDILIGGSGKDTLDGGEGSDWICYFGRSESVSVKLSGATDTKVYIAGLAEDTVRNVENVAGGKGNDLLIGDSLANQLFGYDGNDTLKGGGGKDQLDGGKGIDTADYSDKSTSVRVTLKGASIANVTVGGAQEDTLVNIENLIGGTAADRLVGDENANYLSGQGGIDVLIGNGGVDILRGGSGTDYFVFSSIADSGNFEGKRDIIEDFSGRYDIIDLSSIDASTILFGNNTFIWRGLAQFTTNSQGEVRYSQFDNAGTSNDYTIIFVDNDSDRSSEMQIQLNGVFTLNASDFLL
jgi:Ca2+-binding RTX toxin-like protein